MEPDRISWQWWAAGWSIHPALRAGDATEAARYALDHQAQLRLSQIPWSRGWRDVAGSRLRRRSAGAADQSASSTNRASAQQHSVGSALLLAGPPPSCRCSSCPCGSSGRPPQPGQPGWSRQSAELAVFRWSPAAVATLAGVWAWLSILGHSYPPAGRSPHLRLVPELNFALSTRSRSGSLRS